MSITVRILLNTRAGSNVIPYVNYSINGDQYNHAGVKNSVPHNMLLMIIFVYYIKILLWTLVPNMLVRGTRQVAGPKVEQLIKGG